MNYMDRILNGLPEEMKCEIYCHLIDLQQESARKLARIHKPQHLLDIECLETERFPIGSSFAANRLVHFRASYCNSSRYCDEIKLLIPVDLMYSDPDIQLKTNTSRRYVAESVWAWKYIKAERPDENEKIIVRYLRAKECRRNWKKITDDE